MLMMFEADFGDIKVSKTKIRSLRNSPTEENEIYIVMWDVENLLGGVIPKGSCRVIQMVKVPQSCPHCHKELPMGFARFDDLKDVETFEYHGAIIKGINKIAGDEYSAMDMVELRIHYETLVYKNHITNRIMVLNGKD